MEKCMLFMELCGVTTYDYRFHSSRIITYLCCHAMANWPPHSMCIIMRKDSGGHPWRNAWLCFQAPTSSFEHFLGNNMGNSNHAPFFWEIVWESGRHETEVIYVVEWNIKHCFNHLPWTSEGVVYPRCSYPTHGSSLL